MKLKQNKKKRKHSCLTVAMRSYTAETVPPTKETWGLDLTSNWKIDVYVAHLRQGCHNFKKKWHF